jgi:hypothetical protein
MMNSGGGYGYQSYGNQIAGGETAMFWEDLSSAGLIDGTFNSGLSTNFTNWVVTATTSPPISALLPVANIGRGNYIYVYSNNSVNYFGLSILNSIYGGQADGPPGLTVLEASSIDKKIDDGLPQTGAVTASYLNQPLGNLVLWAKSYGQYDYGPDTTATAGSATTCFDNGNAAGATQQYSVEINGGSNATCALSFQFQ